MGELKVVGQKGIFLTFMVFLLIGAALALNVVMKQTSIREERSLIEESSLREINETFDNLYSQAIVSREGYAGEVQSRILPLNEYDYGSNWFMASQIIPVRDDSIQDMYDAFNLFEIFVEEKSDMNVNADVIKDKDWDIDADDYPEIGYLILPQCVKYTIGHDTQNDKSRNIMLIETGSAAECSYDTDNTSTHTVDVEVTLGAECDLEEITCDEGFDAGGEACENEAYDGTSSGWAIINLKIMDCDDGSHPNCVDLITSSVLNADGERIIAGHLDSDVTNEIYLDVKGTGDCQEGIHIEFYKTTSHTTDDPVFMAYRGKNNPGNPGKEDPIVNISNTILFFNDIESVELDAVDLSVQRENFDYCRRSRGGTCS